MDQSGATFTLSANLKPGGGSDGLSPGLDYARVTFGEIDLPLWITGFQKQGSQWSYTGTGGAVSAVLEKLSDGSVNVTAQASGLLLSTVKFPTSLALWIGDDFASATVTLTGALQFP